MKRKIIVGFIGLTTPFLAHSQSYHQYFDGADTLVSNSILIDMDTSASNVWQIGTPQKVIFNRAATLPNAIVTDTVNFYPTDNTSRFRIRIYNDWGGWGIFALQWMQKLDMDAAFDGGVVEFSMDSGNTWQNAFNNPYVYNFYGFDPVNEGMLMNGDYAFTGTDSTWKNIWLCFDMSWMSVFPDTIHFRFTFTSDSVDNNKEGWLIDNMMAGITWIHTVSETEQKEYMKVTPNPTTGKVNITAKKRDAFHIIEKIELVNVEGKVVQQWGISPTRFYVDISQHPEGIYFLRIKTNITSETFKVVLER